MDVATPDAGAPETGARNRSTPLLLLAGAVVVTVVAVVALFGVERPPTLPSLQDDPSPAPSAAIAWTTYRDGPCLDLATPAGDIREVRCGDQVSELVGWDAGGGVLLVDWSGRRPALLAIDPETGDLSTVASDVDEGWLEEQRPDRVDLQSRRVGDELVLEGSAGQQLWRVEAPQAYTVRAMSVSPDGRWYVAVDSAGRILLISADASAPVRVWASDADTWVDPVWEGSTELDQMELTADR